jgi:hypothetical protein
MIRFDDFEYEIRVEECFGPSHPPCMRGKYEACSIVKNFSFGRKHNDRKKKMAIINSSRRTGTRYNKKNLFRDD